MKHQTKYYLDFIPIIIVVIYTVVCVGVMISENINLLWQHYLGLVLLLINLIVLYKHHQWGIILFGFILVLGLFTLISFDVGLQVNWVKITAAEIPIFWGNALCLLWLIIHLTFSFRYYVGIATKLYWNKLLKDKAI